MLAEFDNRHAVPRAKVGQVNGLNSTQTLWFIQASIKLLLTRASASLLSNCSSPDSGAAKFVPTLILRCGRGICPAYFALQTVNFRLPVQEISRSHRYIRIAGFTYLMQLVIDLDTMA